MKIELLKLAHARSGDKGDTANVGVIALLANVVVIVAVSLATRSSTATGRVGGSPDPPLKASPRGRS